MAAASAAPGRPAPFTRAVARRAPGAAPARAVLVDDVATTGGTLAACAQALRAGGTEEVVAVTFARTLGR